jgi:hypothetical protein
MARDDFPEIPGNFPDGYVPFFMREDGPGDWWNFDNTSNFWCCDSGGINMQWWFYLDMWFLLWMFMEFGDFSCPMDAESSFYIWDECYDNVLFTFDYSVVTDDYSGEVVMTGSEFKEMALRIEANDEFGSHAPYIWMQHTNGMTFGTQDDEEQEIRFFTSDTTVNLDPGDGYYFCFGIDSSPTPGIQDSVISASGMSTPTQFDRNIFLKPSEYGKVKFGEYSTDGAKTITGYIEIVTADGKIRKLAVIDDEDEYQEQHQAV